MGMTYFKHEKGKVSKKGVEERRKINGRLWQGFRGSLSECCHYNLIGRTIENQKTKDYGQKKHF